MKEYISHTVISLCVIGIVFAYITPVTMYAMPKEIYTKLPFAFAVSMIFLIGLLWNERSRDERDAQHIALSGRISFLVGLCIISFGIIEGIIDGEVNKYLVYALTAMILTKTLTRIYTDIKQ